MEVGRLMEGSLAIILAVVGIGLYFELLERIG